MVGRCAGVPGVNKGSLVEICADEFYATHVRLGEPGAPQVAIHKFTAPKVESLEVSSREVRPFEVEPAQRHQLRELFTEIEHIFTVPVAWLKFEGITNDSWLCLIDI